MWSQRSRSTDGTLDEEVVYTKTRECSFSAKSSHSKRQKITPLIAPKANEEQMETL